MLTKNEIEENEFQNAETLKEAKIKIKHHKIDISGMSEYILTNPIPYSITISDINNITLEDASRTIPF